jgi:tetratricopeptide (TPR) repeat protein
VLHNLAVLLARQRQVAKARPLLEAAIPHERAAYEAEPDKYRGKLLQHYQTLLQAVLQLRDHAAAAEAAGEMARIAGGGWKTSYEASRTLDRCARLAEDDPHLGADRRQELARRYTRQAWDLLVETARRNPDQPEVQRHLAVFLATCPEPKYRDAPRALDLARKAVHQDPKQWSYWGALAIAAYRAGNWKEAVAAGAKARQLNGGRDTLFFLAMAHWQLGERQAAHERYAEAVRWMEQHAPADAGVRRFRDEAAELLGIKKG